MKRLITYALPCYLLLGILITSCRTGKIYQRPSVLLPTAFGEKNNTADTASIADLPWRTFFSDAILVQLIDSGLAKNYDLQYAIRNINIAQAQVKQAGFLWYPQLNTGLGIQFNNYSANGLSGVPGTANRNTSQDFSLSLNLSWEIDIWGKISLQKEAVLANYLLSNEATRAVQTRLVADIASAYFNLLMLDQQLVETRKSLVLSGDFVKLTRLLYDAGEVTYLAIQQAESQRQSNAIQIPAIEQNIQLQENALQLLTGSLPGTVERLVTLTDIHFTDTLSTGLPISILQRRPDVRAKELAVVIANTKVGISHANLYPALNLTAGGGFESIKTSNWFNIPGSLFGLAGATIVQPLLQGRQLKTQFEIAQQQKEQAVIQFKQTVLTAATEVTSALVSIRKLAEQEMIAKERADTLAAAVTNANLLFKNDLANYLEVITAEQNALNAALNLASIRREELDAKVELYRALGGGWK